MNNRMVAGLPGITVGGEVQGPNGGRSVADNHQRIPGDKPSCEVQQLPAFHHPLQSHQQRKWT